MSASCHKIKLQNKDGCTLISNVDLKSIQSLKWFKNGNYAYCTKGQGSLHRFILIPQLKDGDQVDHINGDGLDNRRENLRIVTKSQNAQNSKKRKYQGNKPPSSIYKGVCFDKRQNKWMAYIRDKFLGYYTCQELAALAYNRNAALDFGEFAKLNKVKIGVGL